MIIFHIDTKSCYMYTVQYSEQLSLYKNLIHKYKYKLYTVQYV